MNTFSKLWNIPHAQEAKDKIQEQIRELNITEPKNLEEQALSLAAGMFMRSSLRAIRRSSGAETAGNCLLLLSSVCPSVFTYDNNYFNDRFQGIPMGGYTRIVEKMLEGCEVRTGTDYFKFRKEHSEIAEKIVFTGMIDEYFDYRLGALEYRSVRFETEVLDCENYQGNAVVNYTDREVPYTRIIEHKHFEFGKQPKTVISREYSSEWKVGMEPYYPVNDEKNNELYSRYRALRKRKIT